MITISEVKKNYTKKDFIVDNFMKSSGIYCLVARPKVGKSLFGLQLANSIANGTTFLGFKTNPSPVLYISTEMSSMQICERIEKMNLNFNDDNFFIEDQASKDRKLNHMDLQLVFQDFALNHNGKFIIVDMFTGVDVNNGYDLNNYQDINQYVFPKYRELCQKYGFTILLIHHLNKNNTSLGSTAIDGSVDGIITLKKDNNFPNKLFLKYDSRDYPELELTLKRNDNLVYELSEIEKTDLPTELKIFLNYSIKKKDFEFTASEIVSTLNLLIQPSAFGKLLTNYADVLEKEGLHIESSRVSDKRIKHAIYEEPIDENK